MSERENSGNEAAGWVITVMGRRTVEPVYGPLGKMLREHGLELERVDVLSGGTIDGSEEETSEYACAAVFAGGPVQDEAKLRWDCRELAQAVGVDVGVQERGEYGRERQLFVFDMDSTLIQGEVIDELAKLAGVGEQVAAVTAAAMRGEIEFQESFRRRVALLEGLPEERVTELLGRIPLMHGAERLFKTVRARGAKTAILSGGFTFFGAHLRALLEVDHVYANVLDVREGSVTGQVTAPIVDGARKAALLEEIAAEEGVALEDVVAVGDGANDLPMLRLAGMGVAFHAKPVVREQARFSLSLLGLDSLLYLLGIPDWEWV